MKTIILRLAESERDFGQIAALITSQEDEPTSKPELLDDYQKHQEQAIRMMVAEDVKGNLLGFFWAYRDRLEVNRVWYYLIVNPEQRGQGVGNRLYEDLVQVVEETQAKKLRVRVRDNCPECRAFAERRGFTEQRHQIAMVLDLIGFDYQHYDEIIAQLKCEGFQFTSMDALGNTEENQHKLYFLNDTTGIDIPGSDGEHTWDSFVDFQKHVCQSDWYKPGGQMVVIDTARDAWVAMSAITRLEGNDYAYNLFTGVDRLYRGRELGQAVKVVALRYARDVLNVDKVHTHHDTKNLPMIAIDRKLGYTQMSGTFLMEKILE